MATPSIKIDSDEKLTGTVFKLLGGALAVVIGSAMIIALLNDNFNTFLLLSPFVIGGIYFIIYGHYQSKKFALLGVTPLTLTYGAGIIGGKIIGKIDIAEKDFNQINTLKISCVKYRHSSESTVKTTSSVVYYEDISPNLVFLEQSTNIFLNLIFLTGYLQQGI
jgi:hypothetical protein